MNFDDESPDDNSDRDNTSSYVPRGRRKPVPEGSTILDDNQLLAMFDPGAVLSPEAEDWTLYGLNRLHKARGDWFPNHEVRWSQKPPRKVNLEGLMTDAPITAAIIDVAMNAGDEDHAALACAAAVVSLVLDHPDLLARSSDQNALVEGDRGMRMLRGCPDAIAAAILRARTPDELVDALAALEQDLSLQDEHRLLRRYLVALARALRAPPMDPVPSAPPPRRQGPNADDPAPAPAPATTHGAPVARRHDRHDAQERRALADVWGINDTSEKTGVLGRVLPGSERIAFPGARRVMDANETRAARASAQDLPVAKPNVVTAACVSEFGRAMATLAPAPAHERGLVIALGSLYSNLTARQFASCPVYREPPSDPPAEAFVCLNPFGMCIPTRLTRGLAKPKSNLESYRVPETHAFLPWHRAMAGGELMAYHLSLVPVGEALGDERDLRRARAVLKRHAAATGNPVTLRRLPRALRDALGIVGVGPFETDLLLGRPGRAAHGSARHYFAPSRQHLAELGSKAIAVISDWLGSPFDFGPIAPIGGFVGCWRCPTDQAVQEWMREIFAIDLSRPAGRPTREKVLAHHRRLQAVVHEWFSWATGVRPSAAALDGLLHAQGWLLVDEKKKPGAHRASAGRAIPLDPAGEVLLRAWRQSRQFVRIRLGLAVEPPAFFVVDEDCIARKATLKEIRAPLPTRPFVRNGHRMHFATGLEHHGASHANVHRWVGHWGLGSEPGMPGSSQAPAHLPARDAEALAAFVAGLGLPNVKAVRHGR